jgi:flagellar M-ring protein FliF
VNEYLRQLVEQFQTAWQRFNIGQKLAIVLAPLLVLAAIVSLALWTNQSHYAALYSKLSSKDAGVLVDKLRSEGVPYRIGSDGTTIEVPEDKLYETRLDLASQNMPIGQGVGFEIFDKSSFGITDFNQQVNYQRALEGELSRTIASLGEVESARVELVMPKPSLYEEKEKEATASVVVGLKPNMSLRPEQIRGIVSLVAASVEGLTPQNVTLLDSDGNMLSDLIKDDLADDSASSGSAISGSRLLKQTDAQLEIQRRFEHEIERRVSSMLDKVLGPNRSSVKATAELDFDSKESNSETYEPVVNNQGIVRSSEREIESATGQGTLPGGIPGTESNVPGYQSYNGYPSQNGNSNYSKTKETVNYEINKKVDHVIEAPGTVKRISVAVMVDSLQPQQVDAIKNAATVAAGLDLSRGDQISVENISFDSSFRHNEELANVQAEKQALWVNIGTAALILVIMMMILLFLRSILKPRVVRVQERLIREITRVGEEELGSGDEAAIPLDQAGRPSDQALEDQRRAQIRQQVSKLAREKPQAIAMLIRRWLSEEKG